MFYRLITTIAALLFCGTAFAGPMFNLSFNINGNEGNATLATDDLGGGTFLATSGTLNVTTGAATGTYSLIPVAGLPVGGACSGNPGTVLSPLGAFCFDNLLFPSADPLLDSGGLVFQGGGVEVNIWGNAPDNYSFYASNAASGYFVQDNLITPRWISLMQVPEPASLALLAIGLGGLGFSRRKRR